MASTKDGLQLQSENQRFVSFVFKLETLTGEHNSVTLYVHTFHRVPDINLSRHIVTMARNITGEISATATACSLRELKWVIDYACLSGKNVGDVLKSPVFTIVNIGINDSCRWQLELFPNGHDKDYENYFSIYLILLSDQECKVRFTFKVTDNQGKKVKEEIFSNRVFSATSNNWGFPCFVHRNDIENRNMTGSDKLTIVCEIIVIEDEEQINILKAGAYCGHRQLIEDLEQLMNDNEFSDVEFTIGDKTLRAHKNILSQRSPVFAAMFRNNMKEKRENKVVITDVRHEIFQEMLRYMYAEKVKGIKKIAGELLAAADKYSLDSLKQICEKNLSHNVKANNVLETLRLAELHSVQGLKDKCIQFIVTKAAHIVKKPEFRLLPNSIICDVCSALVDLKK